MSHSKLPLFFCLLGYTLVMRLLPYAMIRLGVGTDPLNFYYPWNFSPMTAVCLFGGVFLADRRLAFVLPLATLLLSNCGIAALSGHVEWGFPAQSWGFTYIIFAIAVGFGTLLRNQNSSRGLTVRALSMGLTFEVLFFVTSNFLVWMTSSAGATPLYEPTAAGLYTCYLAAIPFFGRSLVGTTTFSLLLFSPLAISLPTETAVENSSGNLVPVPVK